MRPLPLAIPKETPEWLRALLCRVEVEVEQEARRGAGLCCETPAEFEEYAASRRGEAHTELRAVLYGPEIGRSE